MELASLADQTHQGILLAQALVESLRKAKIIIPSLAVVERCCAEVVTRAQRRLYKRLTAPLGENQKKKLETLLNVGQGTHQTILAWLRQPAGSPSARNLLDHVAKLQALRQVGLPPDIGRKVDKGILEEKDGVQLLKPMPELAALLDKANANRIFGTKMRSFIKQANAAGVKAIVSQQFEMAAQISAAGLVPIVEPEVDIHCPEKAKAEALLKAGILRSSTNFRLVKWSCSRSRYRKKTTFTLIASNIRMF